MGEEARSDSSELEVAVRTGHLLLSIMERTEEVEMTVIQTGHDGDGIGGEKFSSS